jgi:hypothetical protein
MSAIKFHLFQCLGAALRGLWAPGFVFGQGLLRKYLGLFSQLFVLLLSYEKTRHSLEGYHRRPTRIFLLYFFPKAAEILDLSRGIEFLDKELEERFPQDSPEHPKLVDKLLKVFTLDGKEEWILIHVEVQGYADPHFSQRMFTYFYRLYDRYQKPVTALVIFSP